MVGSDIDALMIAFHGVGFGRGFDEEENLARDPMATPSLGHGGRPMADDTVQMLLWKPHSDVL